jgi:hypothetical protein
MRHDIKVGRCRLNPLKPRVESAWFQRLKLGYDEPLSRFAFNFDLRRYIKDEDIGHVSEANPHLIMENFTTVGQCRLTLCYPR